MRMNYRLKNKKKRNIFFELAVAAVLLLLVFFTRLSGVLAPPLFFLARPLWSAKEYLLSQGTLVTGLFAGEAALVAENKALKEEVQRLHAALLDHDFLQQEYRALVTSLGRLPEDPRVVLAAVLAKPPATPYDTLVIDAGRRQGLTMGDEVREGSVALGDIIEVEQSTSKVALFSAPGRLTGAVLGDGAISVSAHGEGGGAFRFSLPRDVPLKEGDPIFFPGTPPVFFGAVGSIEARPTGPLKTILFRSPVNTAELKWVTIVKTNRE